MQDEEDNDGDPGLEGYDEEDEEDDEESRDRGTCPPTPRPGLPSPFQHFSWGSLAARVGVGPEGQWCLGRG